MLFCYEPYDELVLMQLQQFDKKTVTSVEKEMRSGPAEETVVTDETLELREQTELISRKNRHKLKVKFSQFFGKLDLFLPKIYVLFLCICSDRHLRTF